jgi:hypothetical protein
MKQFLLRKIALFALLVSAATTSFAHSVQIGWHIASNGKVRVYLEHWHGQASQSMAQSFYITASYKIGSAAPVSATYYGSGFFNQTAKANLPDASTITWLAACSGSANTYNDWVYYDFDPPACNTPVTLTIIDGPPAETAEGCSQIFPQTITSNFADTKAPNITAPNINIPLGATSCSSVAVNAYNVTVVDACDANPTVTYSIAPGSLFNVGTTQVTVTATDNMNNVGTATFNVTVADQTGPSFSVIADTLYLDSNGVASTMDTNIIKNASDNCGVASMSLSKSSFNCANRGLNTIVASVIDINGNTTNRNASVYVFDTIRPSITAPKDTTLNTDPASCLATGGAIGSPTLYDNCTYTVTNNAPQSYPVGTTTVRWVIADASGNTDTAYQIVTVLDANLPWVVVSMDSVQAQPGGSTVLDPAVVTNTTLNVTGARIVITANYFSGDVLSVPASALPTGVTSSYNAQTATLDLAGAMTNVELQTALRALTFTTSNSNPAIREVTITAGSVTPGPSGHYYEYVQRSQGYTWSQSKAEAQTRSLYGLQGYLATITSQVENDFIASKLASDGWVGGSDDFNQINSAVGYTLYANQSAAEGNWYWITGPDAGTLISTGNTPNTVVAPNGFMNWAAGEPNNYGGGEYYIQLYSSNAGKWNDLPASSSLSGYVVEYGGSTNDLNCIILSDVVYVRVNTPPSISAISNSSNCPSDVFTTSSFTVSDPETPTANLVVTASSSNQSVVQNGQIVVSGGNGTYQLVITPVQGVQGSSVITASVTDGGGVTTSTSFTFTAIDTVNPAVVGQDVTVYLDAQNSATIVPTDLELQPSTDNCGILSKSLSSSTFTSANLGSNAITLTVLDLNGNSTSVTKTVTVLDTIAPTVSAFGVDSLFLDFAGCNVLLDWRSKISTSDNTPNGVTVVSSLPNPILLSKGLHQITFSLLDAQGNSRGYVFPVNVVDTIVPVIQNAPASVTLYAGTDGLALVSWPNVTATDNCVGASLVSTPALGQSLAIGNHPAVMTATDASGNTITHSFNVVVLDTLAPVVNVGNTTIYLNSAGIAVLNPSSIILSLTDNSGTATFVVSKVTFNASDLGVQTVTVTVTDNSGNSRTVTAQVTVADNLAPVLTTQGATLYLNSVGQASLSNAQVVVSVNDNSGIAPSVSIGQTSFNCNDLGNRTVLVSASDASNNSITKSIVVTVLDTISPSVIVALDTVVAYVPSGQCASPVSWPNQAATDNCGVMSTSYSLVSGSTFAIGSTPVYVTATDYSGNTRTDHFYVVVMDTIAPIFTQLPTVTNVIYGGTECGGTVYFSPAVVFDQCSQAILTGQPVSGTNYAPGTHSVTYVGTDASGNARSYVLTFTVQDLTPPTFTSVPTNITVNNDPGQCSAVVNFTLPGATDYCSTPVVTSYPVSGSTFSKGTTIVTVSAQDSAGNTSTTVFNVTVVDNEAPTVGSIANIVVGQCDAQVTFVNPTITDNCANFTVSQVSGLPNGSIYPVGVTTNSYNVIDAAGNVTSYSFTITVIPTIMPTVPSVTQICDNKSPVDLVSGQSTLQFSGTGVVGSNFNPQLAGPGIHVLTWTFVDTNGCPSSGQISIQVLNAPDQPLVNHVNSTTLGTSAAASYQWFYNWSPIPGATSQTLSTIGNGWYQVKVFNENGCSSVSAPFALGTVGLGEGVLGQVKIFPNPTSSSATVEVAEAWIGSVITVYDMHGRMITSLVATDTNTLIETANWASGVYRVALSSSEGQFTMKSLVVQH